MLILCLPGHSGRVVIISFRAILSGGHMLDLGVSTPLSDRTGADTDMDEV